MSALSTHLISAYTGLMNPSALPPFASASQTVRNPPTLVTSGPMIYNASMHGSFSAYPSFSHSQQLQPPFGSGYFANVPPQTITNANDDLSTRTAQQIATLQAKLDKKLGPEFISQRPGPGGQGKLTYAEGWKIINLANEVFGFNGWSSSITSLAVDYIDYNEQTQRYCVGVTAIVKVTLRDGVYHEDVGFGMLDNCRQKGMALDKCKKEAVTDALKRTLRNFGNLLGNCLYDKEYAKQVVKIQVPPPKLHRSELHRRPEYADPPSSTTCVAGPSNAGPSNMGPPPAVPVRTSLAQSDLPQPLRQTQQSHQQIVFNRHQKSSVATTSTILHPEREAPRSLITHAIPAPATTSTIARSKIIAALAGTSPVSAPSPLPPTNTLVQPESTVQVPPAQLVQQQPQPPQLQPPQRAVQLQKGLSQEEFADFADGDDSFYNELNLESLDASTTLVDVLGLDELPQQQPVTPRNASTTSSRAPATTSGAKGKGRMSEIMSGLLDDPSQPDSSFGVGPPPAYASPMPLPKTSAFTTATGGAVVKGNHGGGGFVIPAGVTRPNRSVPPAHPGHTAGVKRRAEEAFVPSKAGVSGAPGIGGKATTDRTVLGELELGPGGAVLKRVRR